MNPNNVVQLAQKQTDNMRVTPSELLEMALKDVKDNPKIKAVHIILYEPSEDDASSGNYDSMRCGLPWERELSILALAYHRCLTR